MYAPVQTPAVRRSRGAGLSAGAPILAICCLGFILFLIAATIVLALIPVYLSKRSGSSSSSSSPRYYAVMNPATALSEGILDSQSLSNINTAMVSALNLQSGSVVSESGTIATTTGKRKREESELVRESRAGTTQLYYAFHFNKNKCDKCGNMGYLQSIHSFPVTANISINNGAWQVVTFAVSLLLTSSSNNIPSTSTSASTTAGTTSPSYTLSLSALDNLPVGNVDASSLPTLGSAVAKSLSVPDGSVVVDSAQVTSSKKRKRRGFGLIRERRASKHLICIFHFLLSLCPSCSNPTFIKNIETMTITITVTLSIGGTSYPVMVSGSVAPSSTVSTTASVAGSVTTSTIAGATAKVVG
ncbi:unnamed protein product [Adineta steineri]|uniref:Uncharacterized protein n=1 Tax=Adineta steineri TaxID=433720 RepID=A0A820D4S9_9BILA|nr:unnamed protein product [Adineta steineri]CAF4226571.1 unnamed protein product [Adineta steineri]